MNKILVSQIGTIILGICAFIAGMPDSLSSQIPQLFPQSIRAYISILFLIAAYAAHTYTTKAQVKAELERQSSGANPKARPPHYSTIGIFFLASVLSLAACSSISVTSELPLITSSSQLATSAALAAYPQYAPYVHEVSLAVLSVSGSTPPTPAQLQAAIDGIVKGNTGNALVNVLVQDGEETLEAFIIAEYSSVYAKIGTNGDEALAVLNAIATGMDNASLPALAKLRRR